MPLEPEITYIFSNNLFVNEKTVFTELLLSTKTKSSKPES